MHVSRALLGTLLLTSALLAGCSSSSTGNGFSVKAPAAAGGAYEFTATASADNYTWDLGDHLTVAYGKSISHTYDFANGKPTVTLKATKGGVSQEYNQEVVVGTGVNQKATFLMEAQTDWAVTGETVKFSAARSFDPEHDPLRFSWSCLKTAPADRKPAHVHPVIGVPFASPPAGSVTTGKTNLTLPSADETLPGDLCAALGSGTKASTHMATIAGTFTETGIYSIYLLAADGAHPTTSGEYKIYVTKPSERPAPTVSGTLDVKLTGGTSTGSLQQVCGNPSNPAQQQCDQAQTNFDLALGGLSMMVNLTVTPATPEPQPVTAVDWTILRGASTVLSGHTTDTHVVLADPNKLGAGTYTATVTLKTGLQAQVKLDVFVHLDLDPAKVY